MTILNLPSVMRLCNENFNTNILKLSHRMSRSINSHWPKTIMLIGQAIFSQYNIFAKNTPKTGVILSHLKIASFYGYEGLKLTLYVHIKYFVASKGSYPIYSAVYLNGL